MYPDPDCRPPDGEPDAPSLPRRDFLAQATALTAAGLWAGSARAETAASEMVAPSAALDSRLSTPDSRQAPLLPTIRLGEHEVTRLIVGGNPIYGHSHFNHLFSRHMTEYHTPERVMELLHRCQQQGINTWQNSYDERTLDDLQRFRSEGGRLNWLCLGKPDWDEHPERIEHAAGLDPIGIAPHGALCERLFRLGRMDRLEELLARIRDTGVLVGVSAHAPHLIEEVESRGWDVDYYMTALYYLTRPREETAAILNGHVPLGEVYLDSDPERMTAVVRSVEKPCLAYKVLAAGRLVGSAEMIRQRFAWAYANIKPSDAIIVGMYQAFGDQVGMNAELVREVLAAG